MPEVSIISPCLNGMPYLRQMLCSVQKQSVSDWQLIYIDDGSTDGSLEFMHECAQTDSRIVVLTTSGRCGASSARNIGLDFAAGNYVSFLDCDDWWHPDKLKVQISALKSQRAVFACGDYHVCSGDGEILRTQQARRTPTVSNYLRKFVVVGCLTAIYERIHFIDLRFNTVTRKAEDFVFWVNLLIIAEGRGLKCISINSPLAYYRVHEGGKSANKIRHLIAHWNIFRQVFKFSLFKSFVLITFYAANGVRNRWFGKVISGSSLI